MEMQIQRCMTYKDFAASISLLPLTYYGGDGKILYLSLLLTDMKLTAVKAVSDYFDSVDAQHSHHHHHQFYDDHYIVY